MGNCCKPIKQNCDSALLDKKSRDIIESTPMLRGYEKQLTENPSDGKLCSAYGKMLFRMGIQKYALQWLEKSVKLDGADGETYLILSEMQPDPIKMLDILEQGYKKHSKYVSILLKLSSQYLKEKQYEKSQKISTEGLKYEEHHNFLYNIAISNLKRVSYKFDCSYEFSLEPLMKAIKLNPTFYQAYYYLAKIKEKMKQPFDQIHHYYLKCLEFCGEEFPIVFLKLGEFYFISKDYNLICKSGGYLLKAWNDKRISLEKKRKHGISEIFENEVLKQGITMTDPKKLVDLLLAEYSTISRSIIGNYLLFNLYQLLNHSESSFHYLKQTVLLEPTPIVEKFQGKIIEKAQEILELYTVPVHCEPSHTINLFDNSSALIENSVNTMRMSVEYIIPSSGNLQEDAAKTTKNSLIGVVQHTNSFYKELVQLNKMELSKEYPSLHPDTRSSDEKVLDFHGKARHFSGIAKDSQISKQLNR